MNIADGKEPKAFGDDVGSCGERKASDHGEGEFFCPAGKIRGVAVTRKLPNPGTLALCGSALYASLEFSCHRIVT
jgi:hypothetical protein